MMREQRSTLDGFVLVHRTLGATGWQLAAALRRAPTSRTAATLGRLWGFYAAGLRDHHEGESEVIFPLVAARDRGFAEVEQAMQHQHDDVDALLDVAARAFVTAVAVTTQASFDAAAGAVEDLTHALETHLRQEELLALPAVVAAIPAREMAAIERRFVRQIGLKRMALTIAALDQTAERERLSLPPLPPPVRLMLPVWRRRYVHLLAAGGIDAGARLS
jgi:hypothetical protein